MKIFLSLILLAGTAFAQAVPQWITVGKEGGTFTAPSGTVLRYGSPASVYAAAVGDHKVGDASAEAWSDPKTLDADATFAGNNAYFGGDPIPGVYKVVQVLQTSVDQNVRYAAPDGSPAVDVLVSAIPSPSAPTMTLKLDGLQLSNCLNKIAVDSNGDEYFVLVCKNTK